MSTALKQPAPEPAYGHLVRLTVQACQVAKEAAGAAAEGIATGSPALLNSLRLREKELDKLDMEIDSGVTDAITQVTAPEARELLACMKFMIGLERIGDLLLSFGNSAHAAGARLDPQDIRELTQMATVLEKMLTDVGDSFSGRDVKKAIDVLRADAEMDRLRNLIFLRHIENPENIARQASLQVIFMTQSLERAGDHAKNLAEEVCHFVSGHTVRHVLIAYDKPRANVHRLAPHERRSRTAPSTNELFLPCPKEPFSGRPDFGKGPTQSGRNRHLFLEASAAEVRSSPPHEHRQVGTNFSGGEASCQRPQRAAPARNQSPL